MTPPMNAATITVNGTAAVVSYDNTTRPNWPTFAVTGVNPYDPAGYTLAGLRNQTQHSYDHEWGIGVNLKIPTDFTFAVEPLGIVYWSSMLSCTSRYPLRRSVTSPT